MSRWVDDFLHDVRWSLRSHRKSPGVAAIAILTLALGIGSATAVFSLVHAVLLKSLPYPNPEQLVYLWSPNANLDAAPKELGPSNATYYDWQRQAAQFRDLALFIMPSLMRVGENPSDRAAVVRVTGNLFRTLGAQPEMGRPIGPEDDQPGHGDVAVISRRLWTRQYGGARDVLNRTLRLDGRNYRVVGVMPDEFRFPWNWELPRVFGDSPHADIWIPLAWDAKQRGDQGFFGFGDGTVVGRLRPGVSIESAQAQMTALMKQITVAREGPAKDSQVLLTSLLQTAFGDVRQEMWLMLCAVLTVLLITCGNIANLLLARNSGRVHEMAVRSALGASRSRLVRLMVSESVLLSFVGGVLGTALAVAGIRAIVWLAPKAMPRVTDSSIDLPVLLFALASSLVTGLLCGILPAFSASQICLLPRLQAGGSRSVVAGSNRLRHALIAGEVAMSLMLVTAAGLFVRSYVSVATQDNGFAGDVLSTRVELPVGLARERQPAAFRRLLEALRASPEIAAVGMNTFIPMSSGGSISTLVVEGNPADKLSVHQRTVSPGYFEAMGIRLLSGRTFEDRDYGSKVARVVASESFARQYFPGQNALGKRISGGKNEPWQQIIGIVRNVRNTPESAPLGEVYRMYDTDPQSAMHFVLRGPQSLIPRFRSVVRESVPGATIEDFQTMRDRVWENGAPRRFHTSILSGFAVMAVLLAVVGLFGLVAQTVRMRTPEIGLRMALGASKGHVFRMILGQGFRLLGLGALVGIAGSWITARLLSSLLYGVTATDPLTFTAAVTLLVVVGLAACAVPGIRAAQVDPTIALRQD